MKKYAAIFYLFMPLTAAAVDESITQPQVTQENGIQVIDGKKFFPLSGARRQLSSDPSPSALAVINHPRADPRVTPAYRARMNPKVASHMETVETLPSVGNSPDEDILSVFAPEENGLRSRPLNSTSPYRK